MEEFMDMCIEALQAEVTLGTDGLFITYIGDGHYIVQDPVLPECDESYIEGDIRRRLERYYRDNPTSMEMDREWLSTISTKLSTELVPGPKSWF